MFEALAAKRVRDAEQYGGRRVVLHAASGVMVDETGRHLGPVRRPQG